jgi:acyl transferase domain-containing protein
LDNSHSQILIKPWQIPKSRFDLNKWFDETGKQKNATMNRSGAFLDRPGYFDNRLFNLSPREALQTDPLHRMFLTVSHEALEMAGYSPEATLATNSNRIATYFGQTSDDWRDIVLTQGVDIYYAPGICRAFAPGRVNYHFKWGGPSYSVDAACASSIATISLACSALLARECDTALAGGGSILDSPAPFAGLSRGGFLSPEKGCETFHDDADGYVRGEGVGVVVLKRLEDAVADNDNILGVVRGSARNYSKGASSITHPSSEAQQRLYRQILNQNAIDPASVSYVEMHGTGTQAGDFTEMSSVLSTFGQYRSKDNPLVVGAVKANIGHGEAVSSTPILS